MTLTDRELLEKALIPVSRLDGAINESILAELPQLDAKTAYTLDAARINYIITACDQLRKAVDELQLAAVVMGDRMIKDYKNHPNDYE